MFTGVESVGRKHGPCSHVTDFRWSSFVHATECWWRCVVVAVCMTMSKGIVALLSTSSRPVAPFVHLETGTTFSMPYVTTGPSVNSSSFVGHVTVDVTGAPAAANGGRLSLHMRPLIDGAMLAVIRQHHWTVVYYLYDSDHGQWCHQQIQQLRFYPRDAMLAAASAGFAVTGCPCVRHKSEFHTKKAKRISTQTTTHDSQGLLSNQIISYLFAINNLAIATSYHPLCVSPRQ